AFTLGAGTGIIQGVGSPTVRIFAGATFAPYHPDSDGDGVPDSQDQCPNEREDLDGYQDEDGCLDPDNDGDGILDSDDQCHDVPSGPLPDPNNPGCPLADQDHDGFPDIIDQCPTQPENYNGLQDTDGCPDRGPDLVQLVGTQLRILQHVNFATNS